MTTVPTGQIVAMGGGGFSMEPDNPLLDDFVLSLAPRAPARVCFLPTASGDAAGTDMRQTAVVDAQYKNVEALVALAMGSRG